MWLAGADQHPFNYESHHRWECAHLIDEDEECDVVRAQFQESAANAHLIAAAPALYEALENLVIGVGMGWDLDGLVEVSLAALASARGEAV